MTSRLSCLLVVPMWHHSLIAESVDNNIWINTQCHENVSSFHLNHLRTNRIDFVNSRLIMEGKHILNLFVRSNSWFWLGRWKQHRIFFTKLGGLEILDLSYRSASDYQISCPTEGNTVLNLSGDPWWTSKLSNCITNNNWMFLIGKCTLRNVSHRNWSVGPLHFFLPKTLHYRLLK